MKLPDLSIYREHFEEQGVVLPLPAVTVPPGGLLKALPPAPEGRTGWPWTTETDPSVYKKTEHWPKITIVTPSYQQGQFIEETIRSILLQNYPSLEYIVMDGGSTDQTRTILEKYAPWLSFYRCASDGGQGQAINLGFSIASGDCFAYLNSDDTYLSNTLWEVASAFRRTGAKFIYGYGLTYYTAEDRFETVRLMPFLDYFIKIPSLLQPSTFWSATINQPVWEELHCSMDFELWLRLVKGNKRFLLKRPLSIAKVHQDAKTVDPRMKVKWQQDHEKIWAGDAHGEVYEWKRINFLNRMRHRLYKFMKWI